MADIITCKEKLTEALNESATMPAPREVLMATPKHYSVEYVINPHMEGNIGRVNKAKALWQWEVIRDKFRLLGFHVHEAEGQPGLPDMVFTANQSLPFVDPRGQKHAVMSIMHAEQRKEEVPFFEQWYRQNGYNVHYLDARKIADFEGMGDAVWHFKKQILWGGYGFRSSQRVYETISDLLGVPVVMLELTHPAFYHLDTCFCVLNERSVLIYPQAFTGDGMELIHAAFPIVIEASETEARERFACNACCPDGKNVIIQKGCHGVNKALKQHGFAFHEVDTGEFLKSGGSVYCMTLMLW